MVSEKTGYPVEMLELEMGMDSDLGIDSIKRVEILSAIQERLPGAPVIGPEHLGTLRTLGEIAAHLGAGSGTVSPALEAAEARHSALRTRTHSFSGRDTVAATLLAVVSEKTGYPVEMLELEMGMDSDLGIDSIKRVEILSALHERLPGAPLIGPEHLGTLRTLGEIAAHLGSASGNGKGAESDSGAVSATDGGTVAEPPFTLHPSPFTLPPAPPAIGRSTVVPVPLDDGSAADAVTWPTTVSSGSLTTVPRLPPNSVS